MEKTKKLSALLKKTFKTITGIKFMGVKVKLLLCKKIKIIREKMSFLT